MKPIYDLFMETLSHAALQAKSKRQHTAVNQGPIGRPDSYQLLAEDGQNAWYIAERNIPARPKTIIFADEILNLRDKYPEEFELWDELVAHHPVYLWRGSDVPLRDHQPMLRGSDVWQEAGKVKMQSKQEIAAALVAQGLKLDDYLIVDTLQYYAFIQALIDLPESEQEHYSNVSKYHPAVYKIPEYFFTKNNTHCVDNLNDSVLDILKGFNRDASRKISALIFNMTNEMRAELDACRQLDTLRIFDFDGDDALSAIGEDCPPKLELSLGRKSHIGGAMITMPRLPIKELQLSSREYTGAVGLDFINLQSCEKFYLNFSRRAEKINLSKIIFPESAKSIKVEGFQGAQDKLQIPASTVAFYNMSAVSCKIDAVTNQHLKILHVNDHSSKSASYSFFADADIAHSKDMIDLDGDVETWQSLMKTTGRRRLSDNPFLMDNQDIVDFNCMGLQLEELCVSTNKQYAITNLPRTLRSLAIKTMVKCPDLNHLDQLTALAMENIREIDFSRLPKSLRSLSLTSAITLISKELDLSQFPDLEELVIRGAANLQAIKNIPASIKVIKIQNCPNMENLDLSHVKSLHTLELVDIGISSNFPPRINYLTIKSFLNENKFDLNSLGKIEECYSLRITDVKGLTEMCLPKKISEVVIENCGLTKLNVVDCQQMKTLEIRNCDKLQAVGALPDSLEKLLLVNNTNLMQPDIRNLQNLRVVPKIVNDTVMHAAMQASSDLSMRSTPMLGNFEFDRHDVFPGERSPVNEDPVIMSDRVIDRGNQESATALLDFNATRTPDSQTGGPPAKVNFANRNIKATLYCKNGVSKDHYRVHVLDKITLKGKDVIFESALDDLMMVAAHAKEHRGAATITELKQAADYHPNMVVGEIEGKLVPGKPFPIVTAQALSGMDHLSLYADNKDLDYFWSESSKQCFIQLKKGVLTKSVKVAYSYQGDVNYVINSQLPDASKIPESPQRLLDDALWLALDTAIRSKPELVDFMLNPHLTMVEKLESLADYCLAFKNEASTLPPDAQGLEILLDNILQQRGACRHRAESFMALAQYLNVAAAMNANQDHRFVEFAVAANNIVKTRAFDLGGAQMLDLTPADKRGENPFSVKSANPPPPADKIKPRVDRPQNMFVQARICQSMLPFLQSSGPRAPILMLPTGIDPIDVNQAIMQELKSDGFDVMQNHIYIHTPSDFARYMNAAHFSDGKRVKIPGPLSKLIKDGGVLVINWNNFNANQMASYKSILEQKGTIMGEPVSRNLRIISLASRDSQEACEAFLTRTTPYRLDPLFLQQWRQPVLATVDQAKSAAEVDLFHLPNWRERLLGKVYYKGNAIVLSDDGALINAIQSGQPLRVFNPPEADARNEFADLLKRIKTEGKIFFNGKIISKDFQYTLEEKEHSLTADNVEVITDGSQHDLSGVYLNANNLHECMARKVIDNTSHCTVDLPGWLPQQTHFYISDYISKFEWQELIAYAATMPDKTFKFSLLPGAEIEGVARLEVGEKANPLSRMIMTNDTDFCVQHLMQHEEKHDPLIIDVTPVTSYQDLMANLLDERDKNGGILFTHETRQMLQALIGGRTVILNGEISQLLYQQLLPLMQKNAVIHNNGVKITIEGKLFLVMPHQAKEQVLPVEHAVVNYHINDYRQYFPAESQQLIDRLDYLFYLGKTLTHTGLGQPEPPTLSFQYLKHMVHVLETAKSRTMHQSNPIKGLLHYNYPKNSRNYALLNVIAKYLFATPKQTEHARLGKISRFVRKHNIQSREDVAKYGWELLNCCDVAMIHRLLTGGASIYNMNVTIDNNIRSLSSAAIDELYQMVKPLFAMSDDVVSKKSSELKATKQLHELLRDQKARAIFLKGAPGAGKTHTIRHLQELLPAGHYYQGTHRIIEWLQAAATSDAPVILHLDEANMEQPGTWDLFKGLFRNDAAIYYQGKKYDLTPQHKVIFTGNEETLPGRHFHKFFQQYAETIYFTMPLEDWIRDKFILPVLSDLQLLPPRSGIISQHLLWAFYHIKAYSPHLEFSLRDIKSLMQRFALLYRQNPNIEEVMWQTGIDEFSATIQNPEVRQAFIRELSQNIFTAPPAIKPEKSVRAMADIIVPATKQYIVEAIEQDLLMCQQAANGGYYRRGVLLEGGSGVGKSSLYKAILEDHHFSKYADDPRKKYYEISVDDSDIVPYTIIKAFLEGSKVVLDELNLNPRVEALLNDLLEGVMPTDTQYLEMVKDIAKCDTPVPVHGFQLFASQNSGTMSGRQPLSPALRNRLHMIYVDDYTRTELITIVHHYQIPQPEKVVDQYLYERRMHPDLLNTRNLFEWMKTREAKTHKL